MATKAELQADLEAARRQMWELQDILQELATEKGLYGGDIRVALLLAGKIRTQAELISLTGISRANMSHAIKRLTEAGYIRRTDSDGRKLYTLARHAPAAGKSALSNITTVQSTEAAETDKETAKGGEHDG